MCIKTSVSCSGFVYAISIKFREMQSAPNSISTKKFLPPTADYKNTASENLEFTNKEEAEDLLSILCFAKFSNVFIRSAVCL